MSNLFPDLPFWVSLTYQVRQFSDQLCKSQKYLLNSIWWIIPRNTLTGKHSYMGIQKSSNPYIRLTNVSSLACIADNVDRLWNHFPNVFSLGTFHYGGGGLSCNSEWSHDPVLAFVMKMNGSRVRVRGGFRKIIFDFLIKKKKKRRWPLLQARKVNVRHRVLG